MPGIVVVGLQWGDEGKGKMIDLLSEKADLVVRAQGGNNAGHSIAFKDKEYFFHIVPSGLLHSQTRCLIGGGTVINPRILLKEIAQLEKEGIVIKGRLFVSPAAQVIFPHHMELDALLEGKKGKASIGTTKNGIGPAYADAALRQGIRMGELINASLLRAKLEEYTPLLSQPIDIDATFTEYTALAEQLKPYVSPTESLIHDALDANELVLFEGAQGTFLDVTYGTYPFVTSSHTLASGIACGAGVGPSAITHTLGILKAYTTRVGAGPLPTTLSPEEARYFMTPTEAREIGTTTGRTRRIGWFDAVLARHAIKLNGASSIAITKLDILDKLDTIKICTGYRLHGTLLTTPPPLANDWNAIEPEYLEMKGWQTPTTNITKLKELPKNARAYVEKIEELCGISASFLSVGPKREQTLTLKTVV